MSNMSESVPQRIDPETQVPGKVTEERHNPGRARVFGWDWKRPAPWEEIAAYAAELSAVFMEFYDTGDDSYTLIIADHLTSDEEDAEIVEGGYMAPQILDACKQLATEKLLVENPRRRGQGYVDEELTIYQCMLTVAEVASKAGGN